MSNISNTFFDGEQIDLDFSDATGFFGRLKKTYSRRSDAEAPKTFKDKLKRVGGLIPLVAITKAALDDDEPSDKNPSKSINEEILPANRKPRRKSFNKRVSSRRNEIKNQRNRSIAKSKMNVEPSTLPIVAQNTEEKKGFWSKSSTGVKVAIIGGGVVALSLGVWALTRKK